MGFLKTLEMGWNRYQHLLVPLQVSMVDYLRIAPNSRLEAVAAQCRAAPAILLAEGDLEKVLLTMVGLC